MLNVLEEAVSNVLRRKRSEKLGLELKYSVGCHDKGGPVKGLGSEIAGLDKEIRALEAAMEEIVKCQPSPKPNVKPLALPSQPSEKAAPPV